MDEQEQQFLNMLDQFRPVINKVCFMYATNDEPLGDLYQEVVLQLWKAFPRFRGESKMSTWVYRIAMNTCVSNLRHRNVRPQTSSLRLPHGGEPFSRLLYDDDDEQEQENLRELYRLIGELGKLERAIILLWLDEKSYEEIAEILNLSSSNVGVRINRIKEKLRRIKH